MYRLLVSLTALLILSSCGSQRFDYEVKGADEFVTDSYRIRSGKLSILQMQGKDLGELPEGAMDEYRDTIHEDDILTIALFHPSRRDLIETVNYINDKVGFRVVNGKIDIPDLEAVTVAGLTLEEAKHLLEDHYREQIHDIEVFVEYRDRLSRKVDLTGMVGQSYIPVDGKIRLYEVLAKARVPNNANLYMSYVMREGQLLPIDLHRLRNQGDLSRNIVMRGGDKIYIADPMESRVMIMGEVRLPIGIPIITGSISLREALVAAGGIPYTGDRRKIQVIRGNLIDPKIYLLSWNHIIHLPNDSLLLMPGDTVYITEKPITSWNRFISQLLPSMTGLQTGYATYKLLGGG